MAKKICPECLSNEHVTWSLFTDTNSGIADGRLRMHDINIKAALCCEYCSETIEIVNDDGIMAVLNA